MPSLGQNKNQMCTDLVWFFERFDPKACYVVWHTIFVHLQVFQNLIWWTPAAFSGIFVHRSKTVTLRECKSSYLGTALPSFLAQNSKNKGHVQHYGAAALAEVWGALSSHYRHCGCSETPLPCPEQWQHPAQCEPTKNLSCSWPCLLSIGSQ